jgi:hypothetical protein
MNYGGWLVLIITWGIILFLFAFSFVKILTEDNAPDKDADENR